MTRFATTTLALLRATLERSVHVGVAEWQTR